MTVQQLKEIIKDLPDTAKIIASAEGNFNDLFVNLQTGEVIGQCESVFFTPVKFSHNDKAMDILVVSFDD